MRDMINVLFQQAWFGPFGLPKIYPTDERECRKIIGPMGHPVYQDPECYEPAGEVYDIGPFDGLKTSSMWAQRFAQIPIVNYAQARPRMADSLKQPDGLMCPLGMVSVSTGRPGEYECRKSLPTSTMIGPGTQVPPSYGPNQLTYPLPPFAQWPAYGA